MTDGREAIRQPPEGCPPRRLVTGALLLASVLSSAADAQTDPIESARQLIAAGRLEEAIPYLEGARSADPGDPEPLWMLAVARLRLADFPEAMALAEEFATPRSEERERPLAPGERTHRPRSPRWSRGCAAGSAPAGARSSRGPAGSRHPARADGGAGRGDRRPRGSRRRISRATRGAGSAGRPLRAAGAGSRRTGGAGRCGAGGSGVVRGTASSGRSLSPNSGSSNRPLVASRQR